MAAKIKQKDEVMVIVGRDAGKRGTVNKVLSNGKLIVGGINMVKKHQRPNPQANEPGGVIDKEAPIDASNIAIWNADISASDRVGFKIENGKKVRIFKSTQKVIDKK